jgi:D-alanyl-lipoteichoic acid acyltransferase DltB (MBOAT superfamily)
MMRSPWERFVGIWQGEAYRRYLHRRGFTSDTGWSFARRGFLVCWAEPGFHRFWRLWNPGLGFLTFLLYRRLGGNREAPLSTVATFVLSGIAHNLIVLPWLGWSFTLPVTFGCFGTLVALSAPLSRVLRQDRWPAVFNVATNAGLVAAGFDLGFRVNRLMDSC